ncbi:MAG: S1C family serine protease [Actinomycetota bacterium]
MTDHHDEEHRETERLDDTERPDDTERLDPIRPQAERRDPERPDVEPGGFRAQHHWPPPPPPPPGTTAGAPGGVRPAWAWDAPPPGAGRPDIGWAWGPPPRHARRRRGSAIVAAVVAAAVLIASGVGIGIGLSNSGTHSSAQPTFVNPGSNGGGAFNPGGGSPTPAGQTPGQGQTPNSADQSIVDQVRPAVVIIETRIGSGAPGSAAEGGAAGTGMLLNSTGEVLTNNHVIRGATSIEVTVNGTQQYTADVVGADPAADVAVLQLENASGLATIRPADTSNLTVGQRVVAIGNAYGRGGEASATTGSIKALNQTITAGDPGSSPERLGGLIQMNAPIAPGDSGGAVVDTQGDVIGMITAASRTSAVSRTSTAGYAIVLDDALSVVHRIESGQETGDIILGLPGLLGVQVRDLDAAAAARLGLNAGDGALVVQAVDGTPAAGAGITAGAAITSIDGHATGTAVELGNVMHATQPGQDVSVTWVDGSGTHTASLRLITGPAV